MSNTADRWTAPQSQDDARRELAVAYRAAAMFGWTDLGGTHFSCRVPGEPDHFLMLRWGLFFEEVTADNLIVLNLEGEIVDSGNGAEANPAGVTIHAGMYRHAPHVHSIMHTHTPAGISASCHPDGLLPLSQHALRFYGRTSRHPYEGVVLDDSEGPELVEHLGSNELLLLDNHGLLAASSSIPETFSVLYYAEFSAQAQLDVLSTTTDPIMPPAEVCEHTAKQYDDSPGYQYRDWLGIVRMVGRSS